MKPLIGITTGNYTMPEGRASASYHTSYAPNAYSVEKAGGIPVLIPSGLSADTLRDLYEHLDGVLIPGGPDVDPQQYGQPHHPALGKTDPQRDVDEIQVIRWAVEDDRPLFGICRGHQTVNVALGGTLVQDIPSILESDLMHDQEKALLPERLAHDITIEPNSRLASILGATSVAVNSLHHQAVQQPAPGAVVTAYAPDGVIEAFELPDKHFALCVQWHPEVLYVRSDDQPSEKLFSAFIDSAREYAERKRGVIAAR